MDAGLERGDARRWLDADSHSGESTAGRAVVNGYRHAGRGDLEGARRYRSRGWRPELADHSLHEFRGTDRQVASQGWILMREQLLA